MKVAWLWMCVLLLAGQAMAAGKGEVSVSLQQFRVQANGEMPILGVAERVRPGEVIEYRVVYHNVSKQVVRQVVATLPVPADTEWVADSAKPTAQEASLDGQHFAAMPLRRQITLPSGQIAWREVPLKEYRALRWHLGDLAAGQQILVSARVRLSTLPVVETHKK